MIRAMAGNSTMDRPAVVIDDGLGLSGHTQVILYNDSVNTAEHVVLCLMSVFQHPAPLATKIMLEAHTRGRAIAEVEAPA